MTVNTPCRASTARGTCGGSKPYVLQHFVWAGLTHRAVNKVTSRLCSAHLQVSVSPSSTIRIGLPSRAVTWEIDWIHHWTRNHMLWLEIICYDWKLCLETNKLLLSYTSDLLEGIHALGEDVVPHDAHYDRHLDVYAYINIKDLGAGNYWRLDGTYRGINKSQRTVL